MLQVRFFDENTATGERLLIERWPDHLSQAETWKSVKVATDEDIATYPEAWKAYLARQAEQ
jgi:hypothetical protein